MKLFSIWLAITLIVFGTFGGGYHLYLTKNPRKILMVVDTSYPMQTVWHRVPEVLRSIGNRRYTQFSLITEKNHVHGWAPKLKLSSVSPYAPRNLTRLMNKGNYPELDEATETYFLTNAEASETESFTGWKIIRLIP